MQFDWIRFLTDYGIPYWTEGKNCQDGYTNIQCVFCGDNSNHMGLNNYAFYGNCWRCGSHDGFDIVSALAPNERVRDLKEIYNTVHVREVKEKVKYNNTKIILPDKKLRQVQKDYISGRNFDPDYLESKYDLRDGGIHGRTAYRIIIPLYYRGRIVSWEARDYTNKLSVKSLPCLKEHEIIPHNNLLFNLDNCKTDSIILCEGVFDCFRMNDNACSCFTSNITNEQLKLLSCFKRVFILFDPEEEAQKKAEKIAVKLSSIGVDAENIVLQIDSDPGDLSDDEALYIKKELGVR